LLEKAKRRAFRYIFSIAKGCHCNH